MRSLIPRQHVSAGLVGTSGESSTPSSSPPPPPPPSFNPHFFAAVPSPPFVFLTYNPSPAPLLCLLSLHPPPLLSVILISSKTSFPELWELADSEGHHQTLTDSSRHKQLVGVGVLAAIQFQTRSF